MPNKIEVAGLSAWYGPTQVLFDVAFNVPDRAVSAIVGPSGCGKSTLLRCLDRLHEEVPNARSRGRILLDGEEVRDQDPVSIRCRVGMVFQKPNPFPNLSIFENVAAGPRLLGVRGADALDEGVYRALDRAGLWAEVEDHLDDPGTSLSGGQQQRLCIARALAVGPEVLLMDEPCASLDPAATARIEALLTELRTELAVVLVTHNLAQARRSADFTTFLYLGRRIESGTTEQIFERPVEALTENYVRGRFG